MITNVWQQQKYDNNKTHVTGVKGKRKVLLFAWESAKGFIHLIYSSYEPCKIDIIFFTLQMQKVGSKRLRNTEPSLKSHKLQKTKAKFYANMSDTKVHDLSLYVTLLLKK